MLDARIIEALATAYSKALEAETLLKFVNPPKTRKVTKPDGSVWHEVLDCGFAAEMLKENLAEITTQLQASLGHAVKLSAPPPPEGES